MKKKGLTITVKAYRWSHSDKWCERVDDVEFEKIYTGNLKLLVDGEIKRFNREKTLNTYKSVSLGSGNYLMLFTNDFKEDELLIGNSFIDRFIISNNAKILQLHRSIEYQVQSFENKIEYWKKYKR